MNTNKPKVLVDFSIAILPNSGIPLDARWLFKQLRNSEKIEVSGLVYSLDKQNMNFTFNSKNEKHKTLKYAQYLALLDTPQGMHPQPTARIRGFFKRLKRIYKILYKNNFKIYKKETKDFNDVIYRMFFENGLASSDRDLIMNSTFYFTDYFKSASFSRIMKNVPGGAPYLDTKGFDFIVNQDSIPLRSPKETTQIVRYHDPIPLMSPDMFADSYDNASFHYKSILQCIKNGAIYVCNSKPTEEELLSLFPQLEGRTTTIPYTLSSVYKPSLDNDMLFDILESKPSEKFSKYHEGWRKILKEAREKPESFHYISEVATVEPRKNHLRMLKAYTLLRSRLKKHNINLKFIIAGGLGWKYEKILKEMEPLIQKGDVMLMENLHPNELKYLYSHSDAFVYPTLSEGFGLPPVEAMLCEVPVVSSDIKVHRWVQGDAAHYVNPYDYEDIANKVEDVILNRNTSKVKDMIKKGVAIAKQYNAIDNGKKWDQLFEDIKAGKYKTQEERLG